MIKFFRRIRKKLLSENKFTKYLAYAFGEIILVVIGILIALQINAWNTNFKNSQIEYDFYAGVLDDLKNDDLKLSEQIVFYNNRIENLGWLLKQVRQPILSLNQLEFGHKSEPLYYSNVAISYSATFESSKNSGTFSNFKNKEILKNITQYYSNFKEVYDTTTSTKLFINSAYEPLMASLPLNYIDLNSNTFVISSESDDNSDFYKYIAAIEDSRNLIVDFKSFLQNPKFENYLVGDLGRSFNALTTIKKRKLRITEITKEITHFLND